jgi:uncharacterized protein (TIGR02453 family)
MKVTDEFTGFPAEGPAFLEELPSHDKEWLAANRKLYESGVMEPAKAFAAAMGERLQDDISPAIVSQPKVNGSISPINRDVRFSPDKTPYKDHLMFRWWEGTEKKLAPTLMLRMSSTSAGFAAGAQFSSVERWRELIDDEGTGGALVGALDDLGAGRDLDVAGQELKRVPAPYAKDHARGELLRHKAFQVRWPKPLPSAVGSAAFVDWCAERFPALGAVHRWLVDNL